MIKWEKYKDNETLAQIVAPGSNGHNVKLSEAIKKYKSQDFSSEASRYAAHGFAKKILAHMHRDKGINNITIRDAKDLMGALLKSGHPREKTEAIRSALAAIIRLEKTGEAKSPSIARAVENRLHRLKIGSAPLEKLVDLIGPGSSGRFAPLKSDVRKAVASCPPTEFRVVYPSKLMIEKEEERDGARIAVQKMLNQFHPGWVMKWAAGEEVFVVTTEENWRLATKGTVKK